MAHHGTTSYIILPHSAVASSRFLAWLYSTRPSTEKHLLRRAVGILEEGESPTSSPASRAAPERREAAPPALTRAPPAGFGGNAEGSRVRRSKAVVLGEWFLQKRFVAKCSLYFGQMTFSLDRNGGVKEAQVSHDTGAN